MTTYISPPSEGFTWCQAAQHTLLITILLVSIPLHSVSYINTHYST